MPGASVRRGGRTKIPSAPSQLSQIRRTAPESRWLVWPCTPLSRAVSSQKRYPEGPCIFERKAADARTSHRKGAGPNPLLSFPGLTEGTARCGSNGPLRIPMQTRTGGNSLLGIFRGSKPCWQGIDGIGTKVGLRRLGTGGRASELARPRLAAPAQFPGQCERDTTLAGVDVVIERRTKTAEKSLL